MRTIAEMLRWRARRHPSLEAVWFEGKSQTFAELDESTSQLAAGLAGRLALQPGDRVGILDKNSAAYLELFFALDKAGLVAAPLNWRLTPHEIKQIVDDIKPKLIVAGADFKAVCAATGVPTVTFDELPRGGEDPRRDVDGAVCGQFCTSGTTGLPKGAMLTGWNCSMSDFAARSRTGRCAKVAARWCACRCSISAAPSGRSGRCKRDQPSSSCARSCRKHCSRRWSSSASKARSWCRH